MMMMMMMMRKMTSLDVLDDEVDISFPNDFTVYWMHSNFSLCRAGRYWGCTG
jgi:hypothetical protein